MPKVDEYYFTKKANDIIDGAIRVCKVKPVHGVTLRDVVKECKISQGGIYSYFTDIDEIFAEILNRCLTEHKVDESVHLLFEKSGEPKEVITRAFMGMGETIDDVALHYGSIIYEINTLYLSDQQRVQKIHSKIKVANDYMVVFEKICAYVRSLIDAGKINPLIPSERLRVFMATSMQGIVQTVTFAKKSAELEQQMGLKKPEHRAAVGMMEVLAHAVIELLGL